MNNLFEELLKKLDEDIEIFLKKTYEELKYKHQSFENFKKYLSWIDTTELHTILEDFCKKIIEIKFNILNYCKIIGSKCNGYMINIELCDANFSFNEYSVLLIYRECCIYENNYSIIKYNPICILNEYFIESLRLNKINIIFNNKESINLQILKYLIILINFNNNKEYINFKNINDFNNINTINDLDNIFQFDDISDCIYSDEDDSKIKFFFNKIILNTFKQRNIKLKINDLHYCSVKYILPLLKITEADVLNILKKKEVFILNKRNIHKPIIPDDIITIISTFLGFSIFKYRDESSFIDKKILNYNNDYQLTVKDYAYYSMPSYENTIEYKIYDGWFM